MSKQIAGTAGAIIFIGLAAVFVGLCLFSSGRGDPTSAIREKPGNTIRKNPT
jgi:hypothetical protein